MSTVISEDTRSILVPRLIRRVKHYLITERARTIEDASRDEFYFALSRALREEIMVNWTATQRTIKRARARTVHYFSMEFLPGRILSNNITNIQANELIREVATKLGRDVDQVICREIDPGLGNGGLGRLASCFLDSCASLHLPAMGYGLRYHYGIFEQQLWDGVQRENPDCWLLNENPWEFRRDSYKTSVKFGGCLNVDKNEAGEEIYDLRDFEEVRCLPYDMPIVGYEPERHFSVATLRLWTTKESPRNFKLHRFNAGRLGQAAENTELTDILYPNDNNDTGKRIRLKQEFLLVSASLQDIIERYLAYHNDFGAFADKIRIQINDTHPAMVIAELMHLLTKRHHLSWGEAWEITRASTSYTNHTVMREALEEWDVNLFRVLLPRQLVIIERLNQLMCDRVRDRYPGDEERVRRMSIIEDGKIRMAPLAIYGSHKVNGVAALHTEILTQTLFKDYYEWNPDLFINVTNGVTQRRWLLNCNPELSQLVSERIGQGWVNDFEQIRQLKKHAEDPALLIELQEIKKRNKKRFQKYLESEQPYRNEKGEKVEGPWDLNLDSLFDVQVKRMHEYKRQLMNALHLITLYQEFKANPESDRVPRTVIISGKAAAGYEVAKSIIRLIHCIARKVNNDPEIRNKLRVLFLENYSVSKAEAIIPAADLSEQISTAGMEASGTGNMKLTINGALTIGTEDGANVEMKQEVGPEWWPFTFGATSKEIAEVRDSNTYNPFAIYSSNETIQRAVDALRDGTFTTNEEEQRILTELYHYLLDDQGDGPADRFFVLYDLESYIETQKKVEELFRKPTEWARTVLHNIAGMGKFSSDTSIRKYANEIWGLTPCPPDRDMLAEVHAAYAEHDQCHVLLPEE